MESSLSHGCSVAAAMDSDSTDVVVNPLSVLPVSSSASSLTSGWSALLQRGSLVKSSSNGGSATLVSSIHHNGHSSSPMPASPAANSQGSPATTTTISHRVVKSSLSHNNHHNNSNSNSSAVVMAAATAAASAALSETGPNGTGFPKPAYSYSCLIALALKNSRTGCLPVSEIYRFMWYVLNLNLL